MILPLPSERNGLFHFLFDSIFCCIAGDTFDYKSVGRWVGRKEVGCFCFQQKFSFEEFKKNPTTKKSKTKQKTE